MAKMNVALQVYTIREHLQTLEGFTAAMKEVARIGYKYVELAGVGPIDVKEQKRVLKGEGLKTIATHTWVTEIRDNMNKVIDTHKRLGCKYVVMPALPGEYKGAEGYERFGKEASDLGAKLAESGLGLAYHNHSFEFQKYGGRAGLDILFDSADPKFLGAELDTYWVQHGGGSPVTWIRKLSGRVPILHCKDMVMSDGQQVYAEVGEGNLDWAGIFAAAKKAGTKWLAVEQDTCQRPSLESVAISFANLNKMGMC